jgi:hypothetical protein
MKDEALDCFKIYKAEVENQLERKIKHVRSDRRVNIFLMILVNIVWIMELSIRPRRPTHPNQLGLLNRKT